MEDTENEEDMDFQEDPDMEEPEQADILEELWQLEAKLDACLEALEALKTSWKENTTEQSSPIPQLFHHTHSSLSLPKAKTPTTESVGKL